MFLIEFYSTSSCGHKPPIPKHAESTQVALDKQIVYAVLVWYTCFMVLSKTALHLSSHRTLCINCRIHSGVHLTTPIIPIVEHMCLAIIRHEQAQCIIGY